VVTLAYKETTQTTNKGNLEIEFRVPDAEKARLFIEKMGLGEPRIQQKRRIHYVLKDISIDIDFWPMLPPILEDKRCDLDAFQIYTEIYKIPIGGMKELVFSPQNGNAILKKRTQKSA
jgi:hypothetical protein